MALAPATIDRTLETVRPRPSATKSLLRTARKKPLGTFALLLICAVVFLALFANLVTLHDPNRIYAGNSLVAHGTIAPDGRPFILGTDDTGRDEFSRVIFGARISLLVGIFSVVIGTFGGTIFGLVSGYYGGKLDFLLQRLFDCLQSIPTLILALLIVAVLGRSLINVIVVIGVVQIPYANRVVRSAVLSARNHTYIDAARVSGCSDFRIITRYVAVNVMAPVIIIATASLGSAIIAEAFLDFLGMGTPPPTPSWGAMLSEAQPNMIANPQLLLAPGIALSLTVLGWNLAGDALRDILDPRLRRG